SQKKKSLKLLVLGEEAHGKTTFTAALSKILAVKSVNKATPLDEIEDTDTQKIKTSDGDKIQVNFSKVDIESDKLNLMLYDFPNHNEFMDFIQNTQESIDGVILVVDAVECSGENTKEQLKAVSAKLKDTKNMIVFLNKVDLTEDKDQIDLAELTTKDM
ncbi:P-loop containing nucleoside triphosphate hydrolase protein, partial [Neoconidiobolus thromboides FSU 785]